MYRSASKDVVLMASRVAVLEVGEAPSGDDTEGSVA